jgi:integrase
MKGITMNTLTVTGQPNIDPITLIERANLADTTKAQYKKAIKNYLATGNSLSDSEALADYARGLKKSSRGFLKAAIKLWSKEIETITKGQATPQNVASVQATVYRLEALNEAIKVKQTTGNKAHIWLSGPEVKKLLDTPPKNLVGQRDKLILGSLVGAGLRREELAELRFDNIKRMGDRIVFDVKGKGAKDRVIPIADKLAQMIDDWAEVISREGYVIRSLGMNREPKESMSSVAIFQVVRKYGKVIGKPELAPHDLRRTYAQIGVDNGIPIQQISKLLGHASIQTTMRYLNMEIDLEATISDFVPF